MLYETDLRQQEAEVDPNGIGMRQEGSGTEVRVLAVAGGKEVKSKGAPGGLLSRRVRMVLFLRGTSTYLQLQRKPTGKKAESPRQESVACGSCAPW